MFYTNFFTPSGEEGGIFPANAGFAGEDTGHEKFQGMQMNHTNGS
jgi:hypothetical protein